MWQHEYIGRRHIAKANTHKEGKGKHKGEKRTARMLKTNKDNFNYIIFSGPYNQPLIIKQPRLRLFSWELIFIFLKYHPSSRLSLPLPQERLFICKIALHFQEACKSHMMICSQHKINLRQRRSKKFAIQFHCPEISVLTVQETMKIYFQPLR